LRDISRMLTGLADDWERLPLVSMIQAQGLQNEWNRALEYGD
jgi:hypothetical protein